MVVGFEAICRTFLLSDVTRVGQTPEGKPWRQINTLFSTLKTCLKQKLTTKMLKMRYFFEKG